LLPSAKCTRPLFQGRTGCGGRPTGWHDIVTCQRLVRVLFVDFSKAFDIIDHNVLLNKFISNNIPEHIILWSLDFLNNREQFVKIYNSVSNATLVGAGTPQGTVSGPNDFKLVINDLTSNTCYAKYVDDTNILTVSKDVNDVTLQTAANHLVYWAQNNGMMINTNKTKELIVCFNKKVNAEDIPTLCINGGNIDRVTTFKLLGVYVSADLSWDYHVMYLLRKVVLY